MVFLQRGAPVSEQWKISGKKISFPPASDAGFKFLRRPGDWVIAERLRADGTGERQRWMALETHGKLSALAVGGRVWQGELGSASRTQVGSGATDADLT